jgi:hypothetical protein
MGTYKVQHLAGPHPNLSVRRSSTPGNPKRDAEAVVDPSMKACDDGDGMHCMHGGWVGVDQPKQVESSGRGEEVNRRECGQSVEDARRSHRLYHQTLG